MAEAVNKFVIGGEVTGFDDRGNYGFLYMTLHGEERQPDGSYQDASTQVRIMYTSKQKEAASKVRAGFPAFCYVSLCNNLEKGLELKGTQKPIPGIFLTPKRDSAPAAEAAPPAPPPGDEPPF